MVLAPTKNSYIDRRSVFAFQKISNQTTRKKMLAIK